MAGITQKLSAGETGDVTAPKRLKVKPWHWTPDYIQWVDLASWHCQMGCRRTGFPSTALYTPFSEKFATNIHLLGHRGTHLTFFFKPVSRGPEAQYGKNNTTHPFPKCSGTKIALGDIFCARLHGVAPISTPKKHQHPFPRGILGQSQKEPRAWNLIIRNQPL